MSLPVASVFQPCSLFKQMQVCVCVGVCVGVHACVRMNEVGILKCIKAHEDAGIPHINTKRTVAFLISET